MTYSLEIKNLFLYKFLNGDSLKEISKSLNIHYQTLYLWIKKYDYNIKNKEIIKENFLKREPLTLCCIPQLGQIDI